MNERSVRALLWSSGIVMLVGGMVMSPSASLLAFGLAAVLALLAVVFGRRKLRLVAVVLMLVSLLLVVQEYPKANQDFSSYRQHVSGRR
jgi:membrane protein implicated in regulation of membrane protease activity